MCAIIMDQQKISWLSLALIPHIGNRTLWKLYRHFRNAEAILEAKLSDLREVPELRRNAIDALLNKRFVRDPLNEIDRLQKENITFLCWEDEEYPEILRHIPYPPLFLFMKGSYCAEDTLAIGIVGTRYPSLRGRLFAERLASELASSGITIVSGLAVGIDTAAHLGALKANGRTIAVLGCGIDIPYPKQNVPLKERIAQKGAVITEFPLAISPEKWTFPLRNRIVSGLSLGIVVVEAGRRSGALITARLAIEQGREVFAVPGPAGDHRSMGTNALLKQGAKLVERAEDIFDEIELLKNSLKNSKQDVEIINSEGNSLEKKLMEVLSDVPLHIDEICREVKKPVKELLPLLSSLELKGIVRQLPGKYFVLER